MFDSLAQLCFQTSNSHRHLCHMQNLRRCCDYMIPQRERKYESSNLLGAHFAFRADPSGFSSLIV